MPEHKRIAAIVTTFFPNSHAGVLVGKFLTGFATDEGLIAPRTLQRTVDMLPKPDSYYMISKVFGESIAYMYSTRFDMEAVSIRIGNFKIDRDQPEHPHHLSHGDCVRVFEQAITHPGVEFEVVLGSPTATGHSTTWTTAAKRSATTPRIGRRWRKRSASSIDTSAVE